ncbi:hypothetical protein HF851_10175 [Corynebacterium ammoniagenes]|uniref:hypothetical protein n=1 Tax=Corynebacterium ammoniagenes TaxID=1697 RepID=UPI001459EEED|nr:hypothetical protein [Corynebacterium ammoniagenes]NMF32636.1 hypothetical protein [Corynebacterium ammoniagenes]
MTSAGTSLPQGHQFQLDLDTAQRIKDAVVSLDGVAELSAGSFGEVSLLFAGARVGGIRKPSPREDTVIEIHVVVDVSSEKVLQELGAEIRQAAMAACSELTRVDVIFADAISGTNT